jgi:hypothetical protein
MSALVGAVGAATFGKALDSPLGLAAVAWWMAGLPLIPACLLWALWISTHAADEPALKVL